MRTFDQIRRDALIRWAEIPPRYQGVNFGCYDVAKGDQAAFEKVQAYVDRLPENLAEGKGLLLLGPPGVAKTTLGIATLYAAMELDKPVHFTTLAAYIGKHQEAIRLERALDRRPDDHGVFESLSAIAKLIDRVENRFPLVMFDDAGKEYHSGSGYSADTVDATLRARYNNQKSIIVSSNLTPQRISEVYNPTVLSLLSEMCEPVIFRAKDYRTSGR